MEEVFGTKEWAEFTSNLISGCKHDCKYCYAKSMALRFHRKTKDNWKDEVVSTSKLNGKMPNKGGRVMYPSTHDIHPENLSNHLIYLGKLLKAHDEILIVTKPHLECIKAICIGYEAYKEKILFRFTIGSANSEVLKFWEEGAPSFEERLEALKYAHKSGFRTSVSSEPMLDDNIHEVIKQTLPYITDSIWIGKANMLAGRIKINTGIVPLEVFKLKHSQRDEVIKELYNRYKDNPIIKWKESIKKVVGLAVPTTKGLDI
jgi:DNA repair photolyase